MHHLLYRTPFVAIFAVLAACGSGGGEDDDVRRDARLVDLEGSAITAQKASFQTTGDAAVSGGTITLDAGFINAANDAARNGSVNIFGENVEIENGRGELSTGEEVRITYEPARSGAYAGIVDISVGGSFAGAQNGTGTYVFGFETDPTEVDARTGSLIYTGTFQAQGSMNGNTNTSAEYAGDITITADFGGDQDVDVLIDGAVNGIGADLSGTFGLNGNGFAGDLTCKPSCGSGSEIDGNFYGPNAAEVGGVVAVNLELAGGNQYSGAGGFVLTNPSQPPQP